MTAPGIPILISAAEASSCLHASHLVRALKEEALARDLTLDVFGTGDERMQAEGFDIVVDASQMQAMGTTEVLGRLPRILEAGRRLESEAVRRAAPVAVLMDYPDFHFRLAQKLRSRGISCISYIPPKVWIWRRSRMQKMKSLFSRVLCIFPFEEKLYRDAGLSAEYIGNPLAEELPIRLSREEARRILLPGEEIGELDRVVAFLPGSRPGELSRHIPLLKEAAVLTLAELRGRRGQASRLIVLVPFASESQCQEWSPRFQEASVDPGLQYHFFAGRSAECLVASEAGLIKSGTATLEAGVLGLPHAVFYKVSEMTAWVFRNFVQKKNFWSRKRAYQGPVGLVNLFTGWQPGDPLRVPEFLLERATGRNLADCLCALLMDPSEQARQQSVLLELRARVLGRHSGGEESSPESAAAAGDITPSLRAARAILDLALARSGGAER